MTVLTMLSILLFGLIGYKQLPVSDLPNVDFPTINVSATLPGASPDTMASTVATVLEKQFSSIAGIDSMSSVSTYRRHQDHPAVFPGPRHRFRRPGRAVRHLALPPAGCPTACRRRPLFARPTRRPYPILYISLSSPTLPLSVLDQYGQTMSQRLSTDPRGGPGAGARLAEIRGAHPARPEGHEGPDLDADRDRHRRSAPRTPTAPWASSTARTGTLTLQANGQLTEAAAIPQHCRRRPQRPAGPAVGDGHGHRQCRKRPGCGLVLHRTTKAQIDLPRSLQSSRG